MAIEDGLPSYEGFAEEILVGVEEMDSLDLVELTMRIEEAVGDEDDSQVSLELEGMTEAILALPERQRRMAILREGLARGIEFETTMFGLPVLIQPVNPSAEPPRKPDESGDREPRITPEPTTSGALALPIPS